MRRLRACRKEGATRRDQRRLNRGGQLPHRPTRSTPGATNLTRTRTAVAYSNSNHSHPIALSSGNTKAEETTVPIRSRSVGTGGTVDG